MHSLLFLYWRYCNKLRNRSNPPDSVCYPSFVAFPLWMGFAMNCETMRITVPPESFRHPIFLFWRWKRTIANVLLRVRHRENSLAICTVQCFIWYSRECTIESVNAKHGKSEFSWALSRVNSRKCKQVIMVGLVEDSWENSIPCFRHI